MDDRTTKRVICAYVWAIVIAVILSIAFAVDYWLKLKGQGEIMDEVMFWIQIITTFAVCVAVVVSFRSNRITHSAAQAQLFIRFQDMYSDDKMNDDLNLLKKCKDDNKKDFAASWKHRYDDKDSGALKINKARRHVSHYFLSVLDLCDLGYLSKELRDKIISLDGIIVLFEVCVPLEKKKGSDMSAFDRIYDLLPKDIQKKIKR